MTEMGDERLPLAELVEVHRLAWLAEREAELRILGRRLADDVRRRGLPPGVLAAWDQWVAGQRVALGIPPGGRRRPRPPGIGALDGDGPSDSSG